VATERLILSEGGLASLRGVLWHRIPHSLYSPLLNRVRVYESKKTKKREFWEYARKPRYEKVIRIAGNDNLFHYKVYRGAKLQTHITGTAEQIRGRQKRAKYWRRIERFADYFDLSIPESRKKYRDLGEYVDRRRADYLRILDNQVDAKGHPLSASAKKWLRSNAFWTITKNNFIDSVLYEIYSREGVDAGEEIDQEK